MEEPDVQNELAWLRQEVDSLTAQRNRLSADRAEHEKEIRKMRKAIEKQMWRDPYIKDLLRRIASLEHRTSELMRMNGILLRDRL